MIPSGGLLLAIASGLLLRGTEAQNVTYSSSTPRNESCCAEVCPPGRYKVEDYNYYYCNYNYNTGCLDPAGTTEYTPYDANATDAAASILCASCAPLCQRCNGSEIEDCKECISGYVLQTTNENFSCERYDNDSGGGTSIGIIAGAAAGGAALLLLLVVLVCCLLRRRRGRIMKRDQEQGSGMLDGGDVVQMDPVPHEVKGHERTEKAKRPKKHKVAEDPTYVNVKRPTPRPLSIERGHEKVTRYTRDPTVKEKPTMHVSPTEEKELAELPDAPPPPPGAAAPDDEYVITDDDTPAPTFTPTAEKERTKVGHPGGHKADRTTRGEPHDPNHHQQHHHHHHHHHPQRSRTTMDGGGGSADGKYEPGKKRKRNIQSSPSSPNPAAPVSCPELPKFPVEMEADAEAAAAARRRQEPAHQKKLPPPIPPAEDENPTQHGDDGEESDPGEDYINVPSEAKLTDRGRDKKHGVDNPAADLDEPLEFYGNQETIDEVEKARRSGADPRYSNTATLQPVEQDYVAMDVTAGHSDSASADATTDEHPYMNVRFGGAPKS